MTKQSQKLILTAIVAGLVGGGGLTKAFAQEEGAAEAKYECQGGNACKGKGACGGPGHSCAGKNSCKGKGYVYTKDKAECDAILAKMKDMMGKKKKKSS